jgi:LPS-assembly protein
VNVTRIKLFGLVSLFSTVATPVFAQVVEPPVAAQAESYEVDFASDRLDYDQDTDIVTASGNVKMSRDGNRLRANQIVWNRKTGQVVASGGVEAIDPKGNKAYGDSIELTDTLKDGVVQNLLIVLTDGGRLAAKSGTRGDGITRLDYAAYSPCTVVDDLGCPKEPVWKITAVSVVHNPVKDRISYKGARIELFGIPLFVLPGLSHPASGKGGTGFLVPDIKTSSTNGVEFALPAYLKIDKNRDLTLTPHIFTGALPALEAEYRALTSKGAYQIGGYATYSSRQPAGLTTVAATRDFRGYFDASGKFQLDPQWSIKGSIRLVTDRTFLRRYDISRDDRLRSTVEIERVTPTSYFSLSGWGFQTLRAGDSLGQVPIVMPLVDFRKRFDDPVAGGKIDLQLNTIAIGRTGGQDTQRAFAGLQWNLRRITTLGQEVLLTAYGRGDVYHSDESALTTTASYRGSDGWRARGIGAVAAEIRWPLIGQAFGGIQRLTPRLQVVASPATKNLDVPNEDARAVDLEDSNLFALNRFPGYDRWEDGTRITYGVDWALTRPGLSIETNIGQSYRLSSKPSLFPEGTGLTGRVSDVVGRTTVKFKNIVALTHRYRLDKDNFAIRRNEIDATVGTARTYVQVGYLRLNRDVSLGIEDLRDREEVRLGGRIQLARFWSVYGSTIIDLTSKNEDALSVADGYEPVRHRVGLEYEDDCLRLGVSWRRDYESSGEVQRGNTFQLRLSFRNLGR